MQYIPKPRDPPSQSSKNFVYDFDENQKVSIEPLIPLRMAKNTIICNRAKFMDNKSIFHTEIKADVEEKPDEMALEKGIMYAVERRNNWERAEVSSIL